VALGRLRLVPIETSADATRGTRTPPEPPEPPLSRPTWTLALIRPELA
jgi:hypothetical protein